MKLILSLLLICVSSIVSAQQPGVYRTYEDYVSGNIEPYSEYVGSLNLFGLYSVKFKDEEGNSKRLKISARKMWGYTDGERLWRVSKGNKSYLIILLGDMVIYGPHSAEEENGKIEASNQFQSALYSIGLDGRMLPVAMHSYKRVLKKRGEGHIVDEFKKYIKGKRLRNPEWYEFAIYYNNYDKLTKRAIRH